MIFPTTCVTHGSELKSATHIKHMTQFLEQNPEVATLPLTDIGNVSQCVPYYQAMKKIDKKPVLGCQIPICSTFSEIKEGENSNTGFNLLAYAKNAQGWSELLNILVYCNDPSRMNPDVRISMDELEQFDLGGLALAAPAEYSQTLDPKKDFIYYTENSKSGNWDMDEITYNKNMFLFPGHAARLRAVKRKIKGIPPEFIEEDVKKGLINLETPFKDAHKRLYDSIEEFDILHREELPAFSEDDSALLTQMCNRALINMNLHQNNRYVEQLERELNVFIPKGFAGYFLIMADIVGFMNNKGYLTGVARGSAGGCLVSYLTGITKIDPVKYNLMFERFYSPDRHDYPDIDLDLPPSRRDELVQYIEEKYGAEKLGQLSTFGTIKGAGGLKLCLGQSGMSFYQQNAVTDLLPMEGKVAPELKVQNDEYGTKSLVLYALRDDPKAFEQWVKIDKKTNKLSGKWAEEFQLAIDLDETIVSVGKHASAFVLANRPIYKQAPMRYDSRSKRHVVGVEMNSASGLGLVKLDLLSLDLLDKAKYLQEGLKNASFTLTPAPWSKL